MFTRHDTETRRSLQNSASCAFERARMVLADRHEHPLAAALPCVHQAAEMRLAGERPRAVPILPAGVMKTTARSKLRK